MNNYIQLILYIAVMASVTYLIRMIPMALVQKKLKNRFICSFLFYVPYAVLASMTFPAIFAATDSSIASIAGCIVAILLALKNKGLLIVALSASATVFIVECIIRFIG